MKSKLSLKIATVMVLLFCGFFIMQSFTIKSDVPTISIEESMDLESETIEDIPDFGVCRYQLGGVTQRMNPPIVIDNQSIICIKCHQGAPNNLPCPSPFGSSYELIYQGNVVGVATNIVAVSNKCSACQITNLTGITFRSL